MGLDSSQSLTVRILKTTEYSLWDTLVQASAQGCFMQSNAWADFKELEGYQTFRYGLFVGHTLVGGCIIYFYPHISEAKLLLAPGGPILPVNLLHTGLKLLISQGEKSLAPQLGAIALRIEPLWTHLPQGFCEFVRSPVDLVPSETLLIDLKPTLTEIMAAMKPKGRYNIRLSRRYGVETRFTKDSQAIPLFYDIFYQTAQRQQFFSEPYSFFINLCQTLFAANIAEIGFAIWQGQILAAILVVYWGERATYLYGGRSSSYPQVMATYGLHWQAMQQAKMRGHKFYDFYGFTRNPNHAYAKFSRFKRQFGGICTTTIGAQDYIFYEQLADTLIQVLQQHQQVKH
ncbi:MAG: peptidoglycan bridge formation glycyltransferase FemA/FemB family protein [Stigonema ocellatum SAG 48.90 = DSM 106950]|nr:peptidoglycan bridge formation glycyltransferase FemA/FemB family protein [Stigonema ocellatum SAG 48.90 = DSM 106950]